MPVPLRAVIMDVDGTLYRQGPVRRYVAVQLLLYGISHPVEIWKTVRVLAAYRRAQEWLRVRGDAGAAGRQTAIAARQTGYSEAFVSQCVERWMNTVPLRSLERALRPGLISFLDWAREEGLRLAVVSDYEARTKLQALGIDRYFTIMISAQDEEVGFFKPSPRGLQVALRRLDVKPGEAVYVGDRHEVDGAAAVAAGMGGVIISKKTANPVAGVVTINNWIELRALVRPAANPRLY